MTCQPVSFAVQTPRPNGDAPAFFQSCRNTCKADLDIAPITLQKPMQSDLARAEFRQGLHEAGLMIRRESLLRQIASLRRDRKATCSARAELRAVTHETLAMGDRR
jgi:hypothetical protein